MTRCCYEGEYAEEFDRATADRHARRFLRRGLRGSAAVLADDVAARGIGGATVLEVGGGLGGLHVDLLSRGAARAHNVDLSPEWESAAAGVLDELDLADRVDRQVGDLVADDAPTADVVVLHRVVCCYPDWERMLGRAAERTRRVLGLTFPRDSVWARAGVRLANAILRWRGRSFRAFVHPPERMLAALAAEGLEPVSDRRGLVWRTVVLERGDAPTTPASHLDDGR
jgi:hypothetical protein